MDHVSYNKNQMNLLIHYSFEICVYYYFMTSFAWARCRTVGLHTTNGCCDEMASF